MVLTRAPTSLNHRMSTVSMLPSASAWLSVPSCLWCDPVSWSQFQSGDVADVETHTWLTMGAQLALERAKIPGHYCV